MKSEMVYFYISVTLIIVSDMCLYMIGRSEESVFNYTLLLPHLSLHLRLLTCHFPSIPADAVWLYSSIFTCLADIRANCSNINLSAIHLSSFHSTIHTNGVLINCVSLLTCTLSPCPDLMLLLCLWIFPSAYPWPLYLASEYLFIPQELLICICFLCVCFSLYYSFLFPKEKSGFDCWTIDLST